MEADRERAGAAVRYVFDVQGLDCAEEVSLLKRQVGPIVGGEGNLAFDVIKGRMSVLASAGDVSAQRIQRAVGRTGMKAREAGSAEAAPAGDGRRATGQMIMTALSGAFLLLALGLHVALAGRVPGLATLIGEPGPVPWPAVLAYAAAIAGGLRYVVVKAVYAARLLRPDINLLMVIAVAGAIGIGEWFEAATVAFLFALSLLLESWSVARARRAVSALLDLAPETVRLRRGDGREETVRASQAPVGCRFIVRPGERIPLDGIVRAGESAVDQAPITGESRPIDKAPDHTVYAGTINGDGALEIESTKAVTETTLAKIIRLVEAAHSKRARAEQWVEKFARIYTPAVLALALAFLAGPPLIWGAGWSESLYRALVMLVIACPCALVISTPVSIVAALASAARQGVLIKGGSFVELPARLDAIAFDKTGTLTRGTPRVTAIERLCDLDERAILRLAAALEARIDHPLAQAIQDAARTAGDVPEAADDVTASKGRGVTGTLAGTAYWLGSRRMLLDRATPSAELLTRIDALEGDGEEGGQSVVALGTGDQVLGLLTLADTPRAEAAEVIAALKSKGVRRIVMLTGDNPATARAIARQIGVHEVRAGLLPDDKVAAMEELVAGEDGRPGATVAMVGDGVNDAPAMARASFGVAMGAVGSDAAIETADIALMSDDLTRLPWLMGHSRRTLGVIKQNIVFSIAIKALFVALTLGGLATLWGAIAADVVTSLLVIANALRLLSPSVGGGGGGSGLSADGAAPAARSPLGGLSADGAAQAA